MMVDTVEIRFTGTAKTEIPLGKQQTLEKGVRLWHKGEGNFRAAAELPKLLYGYNGRLIADQEELTEAWHRFLAILRTKVEFTTFGITRLHPVWQWRKQAQEVILAFQWSRHPSAKSLPSMLAGGKEVAWGSKNSGWQLVLYGKAADVLRAELRLHGRPLARLADVNQPPDFGKVWIVLQAALAPLTDVKLPEEKRHSFAGCVAKLPPEHQAAFVANYKQGRTPRAVSTFAQEVSNAALAGIGFRVADLVGENGQPPPPCHAQPPKPRGPGRRWQRSDKTLVATPQAIKAASATLTLGTAQNAPTGKPDGKAAQPDADANKPHLAGWGRDGTPIFRGTVGEWQGRHRAGRGFLTETGD